MKLVLKVLTALLVLFLAQWATSEMGQTRAALKERANLRAQVSDKKNEITVLRAEWAYLNRPDRLRALVDLNAEFLQLMPLGPEQFGEIDQIAFPERPGLSGLTDPVDTANRTETRP